KCKPGAVCVDSACGCAPSTPNDCGAACRQCCADTDCSDGNGCTDDTCDGNGVCTSTPGCDQAHCCGGQACFQCCVDAQCSGSQICSGNVCINPCGGTLTPCGGQCVDTSTDPSNCNGCGNICPGTTCAASACTTTCLPGLLDCDQNPV